MIIHDGQMLICSENHLRVVTQMQHRLCIPQNHITPQELVGGVIISPEGHAETERHMSLFGDVIVRILQQSVGILDLWIFVLRCHSGGSGKWHFFMPTEC